MSRTIGQDSLDRAADRRAYRGGSGRSWPQCLRDPAIACGGSRLTVAAVSQSVQVLEDGTPMTATIHPSYLLRIRDADDRALQRSAFVADLRRVWTEIAV